MRGVLAHDSAFWRRLAHLGARHGPGYWLKYSPPVFGLVFACAMPEARKRVEQNLEWVRGSVGRRQERREVFRTFVSYAQCLAESLAEGRKEARQCRVRHSGAEGLHAALERGRGAVVVTAHIGPWDVAARLLREVTAAEVLVAMTREPDARARAFHDAVRERGGVEIAHVGEHPLDALPMLRHLKSGGVIAAQLDRGAPSGRVLKVELLGRFFEVPEGPFRLASLSGAPVIPLFARRVGHFDYEVVISPATYLPTRAKPEALLNAAQSAADAMASFLRETPTQWFRFSP